MATITPDENGFCYEYDAVGNLTSVLPATIDWDTYEDYLENDYGPAVSYSYDSVTKRLSTITTPSATYAFSYDGFGNSTAITVGNRTYRFRL